MPLASWATDDVRQVGSAIGVPFAAHYRDGDEGTASPEPGIRVSGTTLKVQAPPIRTTEDVPSRALRKHHHGMISRALAALEDSDFDNQEFTSVTLKIHPKKIPLAKKMIREFRDTFNDQLEDGNACHVYQMNFQLFEHTKPGGESVLPNHHRDLDA